MTSIHAYDPASAGAALPELPPLPIGALAAGAAELLQQAADLAAPTSITVYHTQHISVQFAPDRASVRAITRWALRFGSVMTSHPGTVEYDTGVQAGTFHRTDFEYYGIAVEAFAFLPAGPAAPSHPRSADQQGNTTDGR
jgi:hypothetical protein